jgi:hypothetical protein
MQRLQSGGDIAAASRARTVLRITLGAAQISLSQAAARMRQVYLEIVN